MSRVTAQLAKPIGLSPAVAPGTRARHSRSQSNSPGEGCDCLICWETFNSTTRIPHMLLCGHTLCRKCVLGLPPATLPWLHLLLLYSISCPWCKWMTPRLFWKGMLVYPPKNFSLMWLVETLRIPILSPRSPPSPLPIATRPPTRPRVFVTPTIAPRQVSPPPASAHEGLQLSPAFGNFGPRGREIEDQSWGLQPVEPRWEAIRVERANHLEQVEPRRDVVRMERVNDLEQGQPRWVSILTSLIAYAAGFEQEERSWMSMLSSTSSWFMRKLPYILALSVLLIFVAPIPVIILGSFFAIFSTLAILVLPCSFSIAGIIMCACHLVQQMLRR